MPPVAPFSIAEQHAMRLDGLLFNVFGTLLPCDEPDTFTTRIRVARLSAPPQYILDGLSASWVWGAVPAPPAEPEFCQSMAERGTDRFNEYRSQRYVRLSPDDIVRTEAGSVLSPWRTLLHVLRWKPDVSEACVRSLLELLGVDAHQAATRIERTMARNQHAFYTRPLQRFQLTLASAHSSLHSAKYDETARESSSVTRHASRITRQ